MPKLLIQNLGWKQKRFNSLLNILSPFAKRISKELQLKNNIIVHCYPKNGKDIRSEYDEGVILLFDNTPSPLFDFIHELGHQLFREEKISITIKARLRNIKRELDKNKGDGRIFINEHTYRDIKEVWATMFKWYILGKVSAEGYLEVLNNFQPKAQKLVEDIIEKEDLVKSKNLFDNFYKSKELKEYYRNAKMFEEKDFDNEWIDNCNNRIEQDIKSTEEAIDLIKNDKIQEKTKYKSVPISIEWKKGQIRSWPGSKYKNNMHYDYGYIRGTDSEDGEEIDICLRDKPLKSAKVYKLTQLIDGKYDEEKYGLGFKSAKEFENAYKKTMTKEMFGGINEMTWRKFKKDVLPFYRKSMKMILGLFKAKQKYKIYIDMDGVLTDFIKQYQKLTGETLKPNTRDDDEFWNKIKKAGEKFWSTMPWTKDGKKLWKYISKYNPILLTTPSCENESKTGKRKWIDNNISKKQKVIFAFNKEEYAGKNTILIDDKASNIDHFEDISYGGIGILYKNADKTIKELKKIL